MALIILGVMKVTVTINSLRTATRDTVYLSVHNLNCMEKIRQDFVYGDRSPLLYYGDDELGDLYITTSAELSQSSWGNYNIYYVVLKSRMRESSVSLTNEFMFTDIGEFKFTEEADVLE